MSHVNSTRKKQSSKDNMQLTQERGRDKTEYRPVGRLDTR